MPRSGREVSLGSDGTDGNGGDVELGQIGIEGNGTMQDLSNSA